MIAVINTGGANIASIKNALDRLEKDSILTEDPQLIRSASHVILPGVGAAEDSMVRLEKAGLINVIKGLKQPTLGICLGMQLLFSRSEEGNIPCLDLIPGTVKLLASQPGLTIPHMGWNRLKAVRETKLLFNIADRSYFYFVHSYQAPMGPWVCGTAWHGREFPALVKKNNFYGVQFHPERSSAGGAQLLRNFLSL